MINKEIILNADGTIKKDFSDRAIPQNSNNQVSVNVLIPSTCFTGLQNYAVLLAVSRIIGNSETTLNTLVMSVSKSITIDGVVYVKYTAYLTTDYTDKLGQLKVSPYIQTTATTLVDDEATEVITIQQSFTNSNLNVIKSVLPQYDASLEEATIATTLETQINGKKIYTFVDTDSASVGQHYYELATGYNPTADQFKGCLVVSVFDGETRQYIPYLNDGDVELLEITKNGVFYNISGVDYSNSTYTYTRQQISYSKSEVDGIETNLQTQINGKANQSDLTALNNQINGENGIKDKVDLLSERTNAYMEIKNSLGTIDVLTTDWVANTGDTEYPYKWTLTNGYLEGAVNCIVVYSKDSDTSMLSATTGIDEENGKLIIYASELPTETISIEKIAVFNDLNAYINYSNEIVQQVMQNTSAISDINNTKLPQYVKGTTTYEKTIGSVETTTNHKITTSQPNSSGISKYEIANTQDINDDGTTFDNKSRLTLKTDSIQLQWRNGTDTSNFKNHELTIDTDGFELKYYDKTSGVANTHTLTFDANGDLKVDGNVVGGGKQLYQHNIQMQRSQNNPRVNILFTIVNDDDTPFTFNSILDYLANNNYKYNPNKAYYEQKLMGCTGQDYNSSNSNAYAIYGVCWYDSTQIAYMVSTLLSMNYLAVSGFDSITDNVIAL